MKLSDSSLAALRAGGLSVPDEPFFPHNHVAYPNGYVVCKPVKAGGNSIPGCEMWFTNEAGEDEPSDAPSTNIWFDGTGWVVSVWEWTPGPGPGDFTRRFREESDAVHLILQYYFGDSPEFREAYDVAIHRLGSQTDRMAVTGLTLAGGRGSRMGNIDKGLTPFRGQPMVAHVLKRLQPQVGALLINANRNLSQYEEIGGGFGAPVIADEIPDFAGPLAGFERGLAHCKTEWLITAPCDSPFLPLDLVARLQHGASAANADIAYPKTGDQVQPIFCLLRACLLPSLRRFLASGQRKIDKWTVQHAMVEVPFEDEAAFANINTQDELKQFQ